MAISRRGMLAGVLTIVAPHNAIAQTPTTRALEDFGRYIDAAAELFGEFLVGVRSAEAGTLNTGRVRQTLESISAVFADLAMANGDTVSELEFYSYRVRHGADATRAWRSVVAQAQTTSDVVRDVMDAIDATPQLRVVFSPEQMATLSETLAGRRAILDRLQQLPPPTTEEELTQLDQLVVRYRRLMRSLRELRVALETILSPQK